MSRIFPPLSLLLVTLQLAAIGLLSATASADFEDFLPAYPDSGMLNVRDFGAKGDGVSDDLPAIQAAIAKAVGGNGRYARPPFVYFPAGTYLLGGPLEGRVQDAWSAGWRSGVMLMGESRSKVVLKLQDRHPAFQDPSKPRALIMTGSESDKPREDGWGNRAFRHNIFNLTVDTGKENPGAIGIDYLVNNRGAIRNVTIRSSDPSGAGVTGLAMNRQWPGPGLVKNVRIEGFDTGIQMLSHGQYSMTFENIALTGQRVIGIDNHRNGLFIEDLSFEGSVPLLRQTDLGGMIVIVNGQIVSSSAEPIIQNAGAMVLRNLEVKSPGPALVSTVPDHAATLPSGRIDEWISEAPFGRGGERTLGLPIKKSPEFVSTKPQEWQNAAEFMVDGEDPTAAIQKALDAGKPVVYFPNGSYTVSRTLVVPPGVRKITGLQSAISPSEDQFQGRGLLEVTGGSDPLVIEHFWFSKGTKKGEPSSKMKPVVQNSKRPLVFRHVDFHGGYENTAQGTGDVFFEDTIGTPIRIQHPQSLWGRQVNCEFLDDEPMIQNQGGTVWLLGYKTEGQQIILESNGGKVEVLGGLAYALGGEREKYDKLPMFRLKRTNASLSLVGNGNDWTTVIDGDTNLMSSELPRRGRAARLVLYRN